MQTQVQDTPSTTPDTPDIASILTQGVEGAATTPETTTPPESKPADTPEAKLDAPADDELLDENLIRQRADYLKGKNAVHKRQQELDAREAELKAREEGLAAAPKTAAEVESAAPATPDAQVAAFYESIGLPTGGFDELVTELDDKEWDDESKPLVDHANSLAKAIKAQNKIIGMLWQELNSHGTVVQETVQQRTEATARTIGTQVESAVKAIDEKWGIAATETEVAESMKRHLRTLMDDNGGKLPDNAAYRSWLMDHSHEVTEARPSAPKGEAKAPKTLGKQVSQAGSGVPLEGDEKITAILTAGL
jgi:hypothetical protein